MRIIFSWIDAPIPDETLALGTIIWLSNEFNSYSFSVIGVYTISADSGKKVNDFWTSNLLLVIRFTIISLLKADPLESLSSEKC